VVVLLTSTSNTMPVQLRCHSLSDDQTKETSTTGSSIVAVWCRNNRDWVL